MPRAVWTLIGTWSGPDILFSPTARPNSATSPCSGKWDRETGARAFQSAATPERREPTTNQSAEGLKISADRKVGRKLQAPLHLRGLTRLASGGSARMRPRELWATKFRLRVT